MGGRGRAVLVEQVSVRPCSPPRLPDDERGVLALLEGQIPRLRHALGAADARRARMQTLHVVPCTPARSHLDRVAGAERLVEALVGVRDRGARGAPHVIQQVPVHRGVLEIFRLDRGYSDRGRGIARLVVGASVVIVLLGSVAAFVAPSAAMAIIGFGVVPAAVIGGLTAFLSFTYDTGFVIHADGSLRVLGWAGIRELDLRKFARVTVAEEKPIDDGSWIGG